MKKKGRITIFPLLVTTVVAITVVWSLPILTVKWYSNFQTVQWSSTDFNQTNSFYLSGIAAGKWHARERPTSSLMSFPGESTNWPPAADRFYRRGYVAGLGMK
jgi:hypothetical protein